MSLSVFSDPAESAPSRQTFPFRFALALGALAVAAACLAGPASARGGGEQEEDAVLYCVAFPEAGMDTQLAQLDPETGAIVTAWTINVSNLGAGSAGLAFDGANLWLSMFELIDSAISRRLYKLAPGVAEPLAVYVFLPEDFENASFDGVAYLDDTEDGVPNGKVYITNIPPADVVIFDPVTEDYDDFLDIDGINDTDEQNYVPVGSLTGVAMDQSLRSWEGDSAGIIFIDDNGVIFDSFETPDQFFSASSVIGDELYMFAPADFQNPLIRVYDMGGTELRQIPLPFPVVAFAGDGIRPYVPPSILSAIVDEEASDFVVEVTFDRPVNLEQATVPENYAISGPGQGTLADNPATAGASGGGGGGFAESVRIGWAAGEPNLDAGALTLTVSNVFGENQVSLRPPGNMATIMLDSPGPSGFIVQ